MTCLQKVITRGVESGDHPVDVDLGPLRERGLEVWERSYTRPGVFVGGSK